jgi:hypothetical protein
VPGRVIPLATTARLLGEAAEAFPAQPDLAASTRRSYQPTVCESALPGTSRPRYIVAKRPLTSRFVVSCCPLLFLRFR